MPRIARAELARQSGMVKAAQRALDILGSFAETHRPATVMEVVRRLNLPQSSASVLLAGLAELGYLEFDPAARTYRPTLRVLLLGAWQQDTLFGQTRLLALMEELRLATGCSVLVGLRRQTSVQYILALRPQQRSLPSELRPGILRPICRAAVGLALLFDETDTNIMRLVRRANAEEADRARRLDAAALLATIQQARGRGWIESHGAMTPGVSVLAVPLPALPGQPPLALGLGAAIEHIDRHRCQLVERLQSVSAQLAVPR